MPLGLPEVFMNAALDFFPDAGIIQKPRQTIDFSLQNGMWLWGPALFFEGGTPMSSCLWKVVVGMALFGFVATLEAAVAKEPTAITNQTKSFEGLDRDAAHEAAMKWIDDLNQHGPLRIKRIVVVERGQRWIATITYTEGE
jgi:hypothetical protein